MYVNNVKHKTFLVFYTPKHTKSSGTTISRILLNRRGRGLDYSWTSFVRWDALTEQSPCEILEDMGHPNLDNQKFGLDNSFQDACSSQCGPVHITIAYSSCACVKYLCVSCYFSKLVLFPKQCSKHDCDLI